MIFICNVKQGFIQRKKYRSKKFLRSNLKSKLDFQNLHR
jgi:hypothetical protein